MFLVKIKSNIAIAMWEVNLDYLCDMHSISIAQQNKLQLYKCCMLQNNILQNNSLL